MVRRRRSVGAWGEECSVNNLTSYRSDIAAKGWQVDHGEERTNGVRSRRLFREVVQRVGVYC